MARDDFARRRPHSGGGRPRALVVDDDAGVRLVAGRILERAGYEVSSAATSEEALRWLAENDRTRLLLSDVDLPGMSGPELLKQVRARWPAIVTLLMSGASREELLSRGTVSEAIPLLVKPFDPAELVAFVDAAMKNAALHQPTDES